METINGRRYEGEGEEGYPIIDIGVSFENSVAVIEFSRTPRWGAYSSPGSKETVEVDHILKKEEVVAAVKEWENGGGFSFSYVV